MIFFSDANLAIDEQYGSLDITRLHLAKSFFSLKKFCTLRDKDDMHRRLFSLILDILYLLSCNFTFVPYYFHIFICY